LGEGWLDADRETVSLSPGAEIWLDVVEFQERLAECRTHGHPQEKACPACLPLLAEAAALYRDDFLAGFTLPDSPGFDEWQFFRTEGLRDALASALERLAHGHSARGEFEQAIAYARRWLALDPLHEPAHRLLMRLYARSGQRAAVLRQGTLSHYPPLRSLNPTISEELGVVILKAVEHHPEDRYQSVDEMKAASWACCTSTPRRAPCRPTAEQEVGDSSP